MKVVPKQQVLSVDLRILVGSNNSGRPVGIFMCQYRLNATSSCRVMTNNRFQTYDTMNMFLLGWFSSNVASGLDKGNLKVFFVVGSRLARPRSTRADKISRFPLWVGRGRPHGDPPERTNTQTHRVLSVAAAPPPSEPRDEISRSGILTLIYNMYMYTCSFLRGSLSTGGL